MRPAMDWEKLKQRTALATTHGPTQQELERVFAERAEALAQATEIDEGAHGSALLAFVHGGVRFALDTTRVLRILRARSLTRIPCAPEHMDRVLYEAGRIVSVIDLSLLFGRGRASDEETRIVLVESDSRWLGIRAEQALGTLRLDLSALTPASPSLDARIATSVRGISDDMTIVLDAASLVRAMQSG